MTGRRKWLVAIAALVAGIGLLQLVRYGEAATNPPVVVEPAWDTPRTRELFFRACVDCHSNETHWPWYSRLAPVSWLVAGDVAEGREHFNVSEWHREQDDAEEAAEKVREGEMPLWFYEPLHPKSWLSAAERGELIRGLEATFGEDAEDDSGKRRRRGRTGG